MAPVLETVAHLATRALESRQTRCYNTLYGRRCSYNRWGGWGRWVLLGVILGLAVLVFFLFACTTARRRRKVGQKPFMGTGWAVPASQKYTGAPMQQNYQNPPPQYGQQNNAQYGQNADYYGGNQYGNNTQYQPPAGAPPGQSNGQYAPPSGPPPAHVR